MLDLDYFFIDKANIEEEISGRGQTFGMVNISVIQVPEFSKKQHFLLLVSVAMPTSDKPVCWLPAADDKP